MTELCTSSLKLLGAGRSGQVYLINSVQGKIARKIFFEDKIANIIHYFFFSSPNPYVWNEDAVISAYYRRKVLGELAYYWFGDRLKIADALDYRWNQEHKAYELDTEFIQGKHVALHQPFSRERDRELPTLVRAIMLPLQKRLDQAGFDGMVWQAGKGNPSSLNNFLLESFTPQQYVFVGIDLESGVPALFPMNLLSLFSFYLPRSIKYRRALFDDVDSTKLKSYVDHHKPSLEARLSEQRYWQLLEWIHQLESHQNAWKSLSRVERSIQYHLKKERITQKQATWYLQHPLIWYAKETSRVFLVCLEAIFINLPVKIFHKLQQIPYRQFLRNFYLFLVSQRFRFNLARNYIATRAQYWQDRKQLKSEDTAYLIRSINEENTSEYLNDFGVHLGIKIFVKSLEYLLVPSLYATGLISGVVLIAWLVAGGPIYRTIYTGWRSLQAAANHYEIPWVALLVGLLPTVGSLAYPCQLLYSARGKQKRLAKFIVYDFFTRIGAKVPAWGGEDTLIEHYCNRCADHITR